MDYPTYATHIVNRIQKNKIKILENINECLKGFKMIKNNIIKDRIDEGDSGNLDMIEEIIKEIREFL